MRDFANKTVYIPGGSTGIGLSAAKQLTTLGASVFLFARTRHKLEAALSEIGPLRRSPGQRCAFMELDVADHAMVKSVMDKAVEAFGVPDLLINCAGRAYPHYFEDITHAQFDDTMKTNLYGIWNTVSALVPHMKQKGGAIVNVSSLAGFIGVFGYTDYAASKFAVVGFSEALRSELRQYNISVAVLCPPDTDTPGFATENHTKPEETRVLSKNAKVMQPDDVAREMIRGIRRETFLIIPCLDGKFVCFMKRHFPALVDAVMSREVAKVQRKNTCGRCR